MRDASGVCGVSPQSETDESHTTRIPRQTLLSLPPTSSSSLSSSSRICPSTSSHFIYCFLFIYQFAVGVCMFQLISLYIRALLEGISAGTLSELAMRTPKSESEFESQSETNDQPTPKFFQYLPSCLLLCMLLVPVPSSFYLPSLSLCLSSFPASSSNSAPFTAAK